MGKYFLKYRKWAGLVAILAAINVIIIAVRPMFWFGSIGLIGVLCWFLITMVILIPYTWLAHNTKNWVKSASAGFFFVILVAGTIFSIPFFINSAPELKASEVKLVANHYFRTGQVTAIEYVEKSIWKVRLVQYGELDIVYYNEETGGFGATPTGKQTQAPALPITTPTTSNLSLKDWNDMKAGKYDTK